MLHLVNLLVENNKLMKLYNIMKLYTTFNIGFFMNICMFDMFKGILEKHHVKFAFILCSYV